MRKSSCLKKDVIQIQGYVHGKDESEDKDGGLNTSPSGLG